MQKHLFAKAGRVLLSGILAFLALTAFCFFYYNVPTHVENPDGSTDYKWEPHAFYSRATEGFAWGRTNNDGFVNTFDYHPDTPVDVLIMGSSQMEGFNVAMDESTAGRLNELLGDKTVYNIGISSHGFPTCCCNLEAAADKYHPAYIVMETGVLLYSDKQLSAVIDGTTEEIPTHSGGLVGVLQGNPYLRLLYAQIANYREKHADGRADAAPAADTAPAASAAGVAGKNSDELLSALLEKLGAIAGKHGATLIVAYHPGTSVAPDGSLRLDTNAAVTSQFAEACRDNDIYFLDMSERFLQEYERSYTLPYGYPNTSVGQGHLNRHGHAMIADELYKLIAEVA